MLLFESGTARSRSRKSNALSITPVSHTCVAGSIFNTLFIVSLSHMWKHQNVVKHTEQGTVCLRELRQNVWLFYSLPNQ